MAYEVGHFVPQNCREAARWVTSAAKEGNAAAQYNLGLRYRDGDGVPANLVFIGQLAAQGCCAQEEAGQFGFQTIRVALNYGLTI